MKPWIKVVLALFLGSIFGLITQQSFPFLEKVGQVFIDLLKMTVGLIVFSSIVTGICHISCPHKLKRIGLRSLVFFIVTTMIAIFNSICVCYWIRPGEGLGMILPKVSQSSSMSMIDQIFALFPSNLFASLASGNILQVIVFATFFSCALLMVKEKGAPVLQFFESLLEVMIRLTQIVMRFAPVGVFALMACSTGQMGWDLLEKLILYLGCNYLACTLQLVFVYSFTVYFLARISLITFYRAMKDAIVYGLSTCSSSATLPISLECVKKNLNIPKEIAGFVLSIGSTINMNGAAIGQISCALFIAQAYGVELTFSSLILLIVSTFLSAVGAAGIPGASIMMMSIILNALELPVEGILLVAGIDRLREMFSTVINVLGDAVAAVYVAKKEEESVELTQEFPAFLKG
ncbi:MAG: dicarboxylate/amino acid:cation symporter [Chlamydiae bacterium]|nr:dicarboxylate/amino acid:cation symporter [Chlamydiota bacterium]